MNAPTLLSDFDYELPEELIAQVPLQQRDASRLLHLDRKFGTVHDHQFLDCLELLQPGDVLVMNNTRVNAWRFEATKLSDKEIVVGEGAKIEVLLLTETGPFEFDCMLKPAKRTRVGTRLQLSPNLIAEVIQKNPSGIQSVKISASSSAELSDMEVYMELQRVGQVPLPPYIHESLDDPERYQTVVAKRGDLSDGSAAAPTAGLHFTHDILNKLQAKGVRLAEVTLHVSIDTFRPIQVDDVTHHEMHGEWCEITPDAAREINNASGRIVAVGTTSVRTLETMAAGPRTVAPGRTISKLFIHPGFQFRVVDGMFTNFHLPKTTMMLMISALASRESVLAAYQHAITGRYRFLSFGDSMLIL